MERCAGWDLDNGDELVVDAIGNSTSCRVARAVGDANLARPGLYQYHPLGLPNHDIAEQAGWSEAAVEQMVKNYAHTSMGALDRVKAAAGVKRDADRDADPVRSRS